MVLKKCLFTKCQTTYVCMYISIVQFLDFQKIGIHEYLCDLHIPAFLIGKKELKEKSYAVIAILKKLKYTF